MAVIGIVVKGGSGAGRKFPPREQPRTSWLCRCGRENRSYAIVCLAPGCKCKRP